MLGVLGESYNRLRSNTKIASTSGSRIYLDFGSISQQKRRDSFLPTELLADEFDRMVGNERYPKVFCGATILSPNTNERTVTKFFTGSKYIGRWNRLGISGKGIYKYPHGVIYDGHFNKNGEFHGTGILTYPNGQRLEGFWRNGKLSPGANFVSKENNLLTDAYCKMPDRRFQIEIQSELQPAGQEYISRTPIPIDIPEGCYDSGDGFYDPKLKVIRCYHNVETVKPVSEMDGWLDEERTKIYKVLDDRSPSDHRFINLLKRWKHGSKSSIETIPVTDKEDWIIENCRRAWSEPTEYRPEFYETWTSGSRKYEEDDILSYYESPINEPLKSVDFTGQLSSNISNILTIIHPDTGASPLVKTKRTQTSSIQALRRMFINPALATVHFYRASKQKQKTRSTLKKRSSSKKNRSFGRYVIPKLKL